MLSLGIVKLDTLLFWLFFFIDLYPVCIKVRVLRGSSPTECKQRRVQWCKPPSPCAQNLLCCRCSISLQKSLEMWAPLNHSGNNTLGKTWGELSDGECLHQKAGLPVFHSVSVVLRWSCGSNSRVYVARGNYSRFAFYAPRHSGRRVLISDPPEEPTYELKCSEGRSVVFPNIMQFLMFVGNYLSDPDSWGFASVQKINATT